MAYSYDWRGTSQTTSTGTGDVKTVTPAEARPRAALVSVETNDARVTVDGSTPGAANGHIFPKAQVPVLVLLGSDTLSFVSTIAGNSILNVTWGY